MLYIFILICMFLCSCSNNDNNSQAEIPSPSPLPTVTIVPTPLNTDIPENTPIAESDILASFKTPLLDKTPERIHNIKLAAEKTDGVIIKSGEIFSFNDIVGNRTEERGYKVASILVGETHKNGVGGGVCQVASTIYNAAKKAEMKIVEHHTHKVEVEYAPDGNDATVNYDNLDLKFKNISEHDIVLNVILHENEVFSEIKKL